MTLLDVDKKNQTKSIFIFSLPQIDITISAPSLDIPDHTGNNGF
jgi:hypothetical protein